MKLFTPPPKKLGVLLPIAPKDPDREAIRKSLLEFLELIGTGLQTEVLLESIIKKLVPSGTELVSAECLYITFTGCVEEFKEALSCSQEDLIDQIEAIEELIQLYIDPKATAEQKEEKLKKLQFRITSDDVVALEGKIKELRELVYNGLQKFIEDEAHASIECIAQVYNTRTLSLFKDVWDEKYQDSSDMKWSDKFTELEAIVEQKNQSQVNYRY